MKGFGILFVILFAFFANPGFSVDFDACRIFLEKLGVTDQASQKAFFDGKQVAFYRPNGSAGSVDGFLQIDGTRLKSLIFSVKARKRDGTLMKIGETPEDGSMGFLLFGDQRDWSDKLGVKLGLKTLELGGMAILNPSIEKLILKLGMQRRTMHIETWDDVVEYWAKDLDL